MIRNVYGFHLHHGELVIYGDNLDLYKDYIDNAVDCIADACRYAANRNMKIFYIKRHKIAGIKEQLVVKMLSKRYGVYSTWKQMKKFTVENEEL